MSSPPLLVSPARFARAAAFLQSAAPLDGALFAFHFFHGPRDAVRAALAASQNSDGGFSRLEPDAGLPASSVLSTCIALHHLADLGTPPEHPLVDRALDYLAATFEPETGVWRLIPVHDNTAPHAPWWHESPEFAANFGHFIDNPRPDVLACLYRLQSPKTDALRERVSELVLERIASADETIEMHGLVCYTRLHRAPGLSPALSEALAHRLPAWIERGVERDPAKWHGYSLRPLDVAPTADSPWHAQLGASVEANLDFLIEQQTDDGSWQPPWNWGDTFPDAWPAAKLRWQAVLTLAALRTLRSYGRIAG